MKLKTILFTFSISLLALGLLIIFSAPTAARNTTTLPKTFASPTATQPAVVAKVAGQPAKVEDEPEETAPSRDGEDQSEKSEAKIEKSSAEELPASEKKEVTVGKVTTAKEKADYWFDKGALCATYGNDRAAIKYFQKTIALDPNRSGAYFEEGISYGQLGEFGRAIALINKALEMQPQNGLYLYGRGRVYLLAGEKDKAMQDFKKAAELDNEDAQNYLEHIARVE